MSRTQPSRTMLLGLLLTAIVVACVSLPVADETVQSRKITFFNIQTSISHERQRLFNLSANSFRSEYATSFLRDFLLKEIIL